MKKTLALIGILGLAAASPALAHDMNGGRSKFQMMDTDGDGMISADEHAAFAQKMFEKADTNGDGQLSKKEFMMAEQAKMKKHMAHKKMHDANANLPEHPLKNSETDTDQK